MSDFKPTRKNDAWATIRGFVYQVDVTIDRWLELKSNEILELERGEDIDKIQQAVDTANPDNSTELLEQVKVREANLTLRSTSALSALALFYEHTVNNKTLNLKFRYLTNARIVKERSLPAVKVPILSAWQGIWKGDIEGKEIKPYLPVIRSLIESANKPSKEFNDKTWNSFKEFTKSSSDSQLVKFIKKVEWSTEQPDPVKITELLQKKIIERYKVTKDQSQSIYQRLFHYVFRLVSQSGMKRLALADLEPLVNVLTSVEDKSANDLFIKLSSLELRVQSLETGHKAIKEEVQILNQKIEEQNYVLEFNYTDLHEACNNASLKKAALTIDNQNIIHRLKFGEEIDQFLARQIRYAAVIGISGAGKSIALSDLTKKLAEDGWTVLFLPISPSDTFKLANVASEQIKENLTPEPRELELSQIIKPWKEENSPSESKGLIFLLDGLEAARPEHIVKQLESLHAWLGNISLEKVKVIFSCRDFDFQTAFQSKLHPLLVEAQNWRQSNHSYKLFEIYNFTSEELDQALAKIGATDLLSVRNDKNETDSHILSLRDLLKHPGTFEHFANLYERGEIQSIQEETWSSLIGRRVEYVLQDISRQINFNIKQIRAELIDFTKSCRTQKSREFSLESDFVKSTFPNWFKTSLQNSKTLYSALISNGMLSEQDISSNEKYVSFRISDAGAYLLSFVLENELEHADNSENLQQMCKDFVTEAWQFSPMLDAMLALIDRNCVPPYSDKILTLLKTIAKSHQYTTLFSLMRPTVLGAVFRLLRQTSQPKENHDYYNYIEATRLIRFSVDNVSLIKRNLNHTNPNIRRLAVEMAGIYKLSELSADITKLLNDNDKDVKRATYRTFGKIGKTAIDELLSEIRNPEYSAEFKTSFIYALNNIGYFTDEISKTLSDIFSSAKESEEKSLLRASLLAAVQLRDPNQNQNAVDLLSNDDEQIALAAAKYLTEVPNKSSWDKLWSILQSAIASENTEKEFDYYSLINQIIAALIKIDRNRAETELYKLIEDGLSENGKLYLMQANSLVKKHDLAFGYPLILDRLLKELESPPPQKFADILSETLGTAWKPKSLQKLIERAERLKSENISISEIFVRAVASNMKKHDEYAIAEGINRVSDLNALIKCQVSDFISKIKPLFDEAPYLSTKEFCNYFWVIGDTDIEDNLIKKFENLSEYDTRWHAQDSILRALGTCGTKRGAEFILSYIKDEVDVSAAFPQECLFPLLQRNILSPQILDKFCRDNKNSAVGRAVSLFALADYSPSQFVDLFIEASRDENHLVQRNAVIALGFTKSQTAVKALRGILVENPDMAIKSYAASALMRLNAPEAVSEIEDTLEDCDIKNDLAIINLLDVLSYFHHDSSIPLILNQLESATHMTRGYYLDALGSFLHHPAASQRLYQELEHSTENSRDFFNEQSLLIRGLTFEWNDEFFNKILGYLRNRRLSENSRREICKNLARVFKNSKSDKNVLAQMMKILLSDYSLENRDRSLNVLTLLPASFSREIYQEMLVSSETTEWERACAVETLGFWKSDQVEIDKMQYDKELLVRRAANKALEHRSKLEALKYHVSEFQNKSGLAKLSAFLCLKEKGILLTIWELYKIKAKKNKTFIDNLVHKIQEKRRTRIQEDQRKQDRELNERGTIYFD